MAANRLVGIVDAVVLWKRLGELLNRLRCWERRVHLQLREHCLCRGERSAV